ncbi:hypothetical protein [uncultured Roseibium sp.]|uniref:hypothetical protein n=1 Tax=uncultured Roseibium sp. TaxID=1936171 RepID=UPI00260254E2|nr:hypothetical protein [uncultured Roseibium sp.]
MLRPKHKEDGMKLVPVSFATLVALLALLTPPVLADEPENCEVDPENEETETLTAEDEANAGKLTDCDGILQPAPVGDMDLVQPAPDTGETPVIAPQELPDQPGKE